MSQHLSRAPSQQPTASQIQRAHQIMAEQAAPQIPSASRRSVLSASRQIAGVPPQHPTQSQYATLAASQQPTQSQYAAFAASQQPTPSQYAALAAAQHAAAQQQPTQSQYAALAAAQQSYPQSQQPTHSQFARFASAVAQIQNKQPTQSQYAEFSAAVAAAHQQAPTRSQYMAAYAAAQQGQEPEIQQQYQQYQPQQQQATYSRLVNLEAQQHPGQYAIDAATIQQAPRFSARFSSRDQPQTFSQYARANLFPSQTTFERQLNLHTFPDLWSREIHQAFNIIPFGFPYIGHPGIFHFSPYNPLAPIENGLF